VVRRRPLRLGYLERTILLGLTAAIGLRLETLLPIRHLTVLQPRLQKAVDRRLVPAGRLGDLLLGVTGKPHLEGELVGTAAQVGAVSGR
jgi:hypothetical protein